jgi:hypothetical protein
MPNETNNPKDGLKENVNNPGNPGGAAPGHFPDQKTHKNQDTNRHQGGSEKQRDDKKS